MCAMRAPRDLHRTSTVVLSSVLLVLGVAMIVVALAGGGGPLAKGVLLGALFTAAGAGRLWVARQ
jgi:hypothetical protein